MNNHFEEDIFASNPFSGYGVGGMYEGMLNSDFEDDMPSLGLRKEPSFLRDDYLFTRRAFYSDIFDQ